MPPKKHVMNEIFKTSRQEYGEIRQLCLICLGLDKTNDKLLESSSYERKSEETKRVFHRIMSGSLKKLAIAFQMNIDHKILHLKDYPILPDGTLYYVNYKHVRKVFNIKDIGDKIINSDSVSNDLIPSEGFGDSKMKTLFTGEHHGEEWALYLSVEGFVEAVLEFLDNLEANGSYQTGPRVDLFAQEDVFDDPQNYHGALF
jgi:hypothetical protein